MKREIKFKGIRVDNGEWVYGDLSCGLYVNHITKEPCCYMLSMPEHGDCDEDIEYIKVHPETVCQFIYNRNGVDFYEGDIMFVDYNYIGNVTIKFIDGAFNCSKYNIDKVKITGNIHDKK